ncbi:receptor-type tyrosine-protein phosphatase H-like [Archocentrus centrarchus]|uniref:receptor-type tyrosine-protein phosphatase H-like n=1 Tax=Archocentrus centrarchus TaxID=63155 RepID=UPI0011EA4C2F|nr:receptor-type tyrosine-protein phosphatase H-like [Archocentrus centrarchus]
MAIDVNLHQLISTGGGITDSAAANTATVTQRETTATQKTILLTSTTQSSTSFAPTTTKSPPENVQNVIVTTQNETSITLQWTKVSNINTYTLEFNGRKIKVTASAGNVTYTVLNLTDGTRYNFSLFTVSANVRSSGVNYTAVTAPRRVNAVTVVKQNETSVTLKWNKVNNISEYFLQYDDSGSVIKKNINVSEDGPVEYVVSPLTAGTNYSFTLFTVFEGVNSSGYKFTAVTAPWDAREFRSIDQNETSITLQWKKVPNFNMYTLVFNEKEINITSVEVVTYSVGNLKSGTKYNFSLFTVFENVRSNGVNHIAVTAPGRVTAVTVVKQNETSVTLKWNKVNNISEYFLQYNYNGSVIKKNISVSQDGPVEYVVSPLTAGTIYSFTLFTVFEGVSSSGYTLSAVTAPENVQNVIVKTQTETSISLQWDKVNKISTYILQYNYNGSVIKKNISVSQEGPVEYVVSPLTAGTIYSFTLFTVFEGVNSRGYRFSAVTAPENVQNVIVKAQTETSISLQWDKVNKISTYILQYNYDGSVIEKNISVSQEGPVEYVVSPLTAGTIYIFTLFTVFEGVNSSGYRFSAVTAPYDTREFRSIAQNETSITLQWEKVPNVNMYTLVFNEKEINITSAEVVTYSVGNLKSGTKYNFSLFTVFENVRSNGVNHIAVTAPGRVTAVNEVRQNETSISLKWDKVDNISEYFLQYDDNGSVIKKNISVSQEGPVEYVVSPLTAGTIYSFTLFTVFEGVKSTGYTFTAVTAPENVQNVIVTTQNETSITLQWTKVSNIDTYTLEFNGRKIKVTASAGNVTYTVLNLTDGTRYNFSLFTVSANVRSSGVNYTAVTAPRRVNAVTVVKQNETSVTLKRDKVNNISTYFLQYDDSGSVIEKNINVSQEGPVEYVVSPLTAGTIYSFTLFTVFEGVSSSGYRFSAVTVPENVQYVIVKAQNEMSIILQWDKVGKISTYILQYDDSGSVIEKNIYVSQEGPVEYVVSSLTAGTIYSFTLFTVFEGVNSSGYRFSAVTAPENVQNVTPVDQTNSDITLTWGKIDNISEYILKYDQEDHINKPQEDPIVHVVSPLTAGTIYSFTLFTVFEGVTSSGYRFSAVTAPWDAREFRSIDQNETSITLQWEKVSNTDTYILEFSERKISVTASSEVVTYTVLNLTDGTRYNFSLFTVFENVRSSGVNYTAVTEKRRVPPPNASVLRVFCHLVVFCPYCISTGLLWSIYSSRKMANKPAVSMEMTKCDDGDDGFEEDFYDTIDYVTTEHDF